jgi:hypothetical protein
MANETSVAKFSMEKFLNTRNKVSYFAGGGGRIAAL